MGYVEVTNLKYGKPLVILSECFYLPSEGMFLPLFALYENGQIIYRKDTINENVDYFEIVLTKNEINTFINSLPFDSIYKIKEKTIDASEGFTDQPMSILELNINGYKKVRINGYKEKYIPKDYLIIYNKLIKYKHKNAYKWYPDNICVKFYKPFSDENYSEWPINLLKIDISAIKDNKENISLVLDNIYLKDYFEFYNSLTSFKNVKIKNIIFSISHEMEYPNIKYMESMCDEEMFKYNNV